MQTTLLGLAIAIILALVAALVGPLLINWGSHRSFFEAAASRLIGINVRVAGDIEARLLPAPRLMLHNIEMGGEIDTIRARSLNIEFALGSLMRGEWRAAEMHLAGPEFSFGLDASGHVHAPNVAVAFKPDELAVDRLSIEDGKVVLTDAANGASVTLDRLWFNGEARSLAGPVKGEGAVTIDGRLFPFRVAAGRLSEEGAVKLRVNIDPVDYPLGIEADGVVAFTGGKPHFDGTMMLSRPAGMGPHHGGQPVQALTQPWRVSGKIKATGQSALMRNVEFQYGSDEQGFRLAGVAELKFGKHPRFDGVLSGRQIDLDRAISGAGATRPPPAAVIRRLAEFGGAAFRPPLPIQIGLGIDQVTIGGKSVQNVRGDISSGASGWNLDRLEFRAPGYTQVRVSGHLAVGDDGVAFIGPAEIEASDPKALAAWLEGRADSGQNDLRPLSLRGDLTLGSDKIAIERLRAEFDRKPVAGRLAYVFASRGRPSKLEAEIRASEFDIDSALGFGRALLADSTVGRPQEMAVAADIGRATIGGVQAHDMRARLKVDGNGLQIDRLSAADFGGGNFAVKGRVETGGHTPHGAISIDFETKQTAAMAGKFAANGVSPLINLLSRVGHAKLRATLDIAGETKTTAVAQLALAGDLDDMRVDARTRVRGDWTKPSAADVDFNGTIDARESAALIEFMGLDSLVATGKGPGQLKMQMAGPIDRDMTLDIKLSADGLSAQASGRGRLSEDQGVKIAATLQVARAGLRPLQAAAAKPGHLPLKLISRVAIAGSAATFEDINAEFDGSTIRGRLAVNYSSPRRIDGALDADAADIASLITRAIGMPLQVAGSGTGWGWSSEPFSKGILGDFTGNVTLKVGRADVLPRVTAREFRAVMALGKDELALHDVTGNLAGGRLSGQVAFHRAENGLTARTKLMLAGTDIAALLPAATRPPISGSLDLMAELEGVGLSPVALIGSLRGSGNITLTDAKVPGLDPRAFDAVTRAVDQGLAIDTGHISGVVTKALESGQLYLKRAMATVAVSSGQIRLSDVVAESKDTALSVAGALDLTDGSIDARFVLSGQGEAAGARPSIFMALKGPLVAPLRSIDVSALNGWLTLRAVENQARRIRAIENAPQRPSGRSAPKNRQAPALPAPINIRPAPAPRSAGPAVSVGSQN